MCIHFGEQRDLKFEVYITSKRTKKIMMSTHNVDKHDEIHTDYKL